MHQLSACPLPKRNSSQLFIGEPGQNHRQFTKGRVTAGLCSVDIQVAFCRFTLVPESIAAQNIDVTHSWFLFCVFCQPHTRLQCKFTIRILHAVQHIWCDRSHNVTQSNRGQNRTGQWGFQHFCKPYKLHVFLEHETAPISSAEKETKDMHNLRDTTPKPLNASNTSSELVFRRSISCNTMEQVGHGTLSVFLQPLSTL